MTSWWSAATAAMVIAAALGNGSKLIIGDLDRDHRTWSSPRADSPEKTLPAAEVAFFDSHRRAAAYLDAGDGRTVYLWSGEPVAYLLEDSIYGFNGKHLGWYTNGMIFDHEGYVVVSPAVAFRKPVEPAPARGLKGQTPSKRQQESKPLQPTLGGAWSDFSASEFFLKTELDFRAGK